jgi:hypothetical protein
MPWNLVRYRYSDPISAQQSPSIPIVSDALRNPGEPRQQSCLKRILKQNRAVKAFGSQMSRLKESTDFLMTCMVRMEALFLATSCAQPQPIITVMQARNSSKI